MMCDKCGSNNIKEIIRKYSGDEIVINYICGECGHIWNDNIIWDR